ncbi:MAG: alpha-amylase family protein, partial [Ruminiclostridium sp.]
MGLINRKDIPYRQIHLDFHTSPFIGEIGAEYNTEKFIETLKKAHVNSINLFTKCHHGMFYYPTKIGTMHPNLKFDLFGEQIRACKENGIRALAYTCVAWNEDWADRHPEWQVVNFDGILGDRNPFSNEYTSWRSLCISNKEYIHLLKEEFKEIYSLYKPQGYWIDIVLGKTCICPECKKQIKALGLDIQKLEDVKRHDRIAEINFCTEMYDYIKSIDDNLEIYFNTHPYELDDAEDLEISSTKKRKYFSFIDIESLPSDMWGYTHFPVAVNYVNKYEQDITMMNGKFHISWGDFGSIRNLEALEYECFRAVANGAKICIGDQLHPGGQLDTTVYARIGQVFESIEKKEPWLIGTKKKSEVAVVIPSKACSSNPQVGNLVEEGVYRVLSELHIPFDYVNFIDDISEYSLVILPDNVQLNREMASKLNEYYSKGGKLLVTGKSAVDKETNQFLLACIGCQFISESDYDVRYVRLIASAFEDIPHIDHVLYTKGFTIKTDKEVLAEIVLPYFNRTFDKFCSHRQTPPMLQASGEPAIVKNDRCVYISSPLFTDYVNNGYKVYRDILQK